MYMAKSMEYMSSYQIWISFFPILSLDFSNAACVGKLLMASSITDSSPAVDNRCKTLSASFLFHVQDWNQIH